MHPVGAKAGVAVPLKYFLETFPIGDCAAKSGCEGNRVIITCKYDFVMLKSQEVFHQDPQHSRPASTNCINAGSSDYARNVPTGIVFKDIVVQVHEVEDNIHRFAPIHSGEFRSWLVFVAPQNYVKNVRTRPQL